MKVHSTWQCNYSIFAIIKRMIFDHFLVMTILLFYWTHDLFYIFCSLALLGSCRKQKRKAQPQNTSLMIIFNRKLFLFLIYCYLEIKPGCLSYEFVITLSKKFCMKNLRIIDKQRKMQTGKSPFLS